MTRHFDLLPPLAHATGDIWRNLRCPLIPSHHDRQAAIVITPACDLEQTKTDVITLLAIVPLYEWFQRFAGLRLLQSIVADAVSATGLKTRPDQLSRELVGIRNQVSRAVDPKSTRAVELMDLLRACISEGTPETFRAFCRSADKQTSKHIDDIIKNSLRNDMFFIPKTNFTSNPAQSALPHDSVALFRYPFSVPLAILDAATTTSSDEDWLSDLATLPIREDERTNLKGRPMKHARLHQDYSQDMVAKFASFYIRLGIPDTPELVAREIHKRIVEP